MANKITYHVAGLKELHDALTQLPEQLVSRKGGPVKTALMSAALPVLRTAQNTVPNRDSVENSGRLMNAIKRKRVTKTGSKENSEAVIVYVKAGANRDDPTGAYYAPFVEFGAKGLDATEWFRNSLDTNKKESIEIFRKRLAAQIERIANNIGRKNLAQVAAKAKALKGI